MISKDRKGFFTISNGNTIIKQKIYDDNIPERSIAQPLPNARKIEANELDENLTEEEILKAQATAITDNIVDEDNVDEDL